jgi:hypothetical protein
MSYELQLPHKKTPFVRTSLRFDRARPASNFLIPIFFKTVLKSKRPFRMNSRPKQNYYRPGGRPTRGRVLPRRVYPDTPPRVVYSVTPLGETLRPLLDAMCKWGKSHSAAMALKKPEASKEEQ